MLNAFVILPDPIVELFDLLQHRPQRPKQLLRNLILRFPRKRLRCAALDPPRRRFHHPPHQVHRLRPHLNQRFPRRDPRQVRLLFLHPVLDRLQQTPIHSRQPCQVLCVQPILFVVAPVDQSQLPWVGYQHLMPTLPPHSRHPARMPSYFHRHHPGRRSRQPATHFRLRTANPVFGPHLSVGSNHSHMGPSVSDVETHCATHWAVAQIFARRGLCFATLLHGGSPLHLECVPG